MKWNQVPDGVSFAMTKDTAMELRAGKPKAFGYGVICGAVLVIALQSCGADESDKKPDPKPGPSVSAPSKPNN